jgi:flagellin
MVASVNGGFLVLTSTNGTNFRVGSSNDTLSDENLGFTSSVGSGAGVNVAAAYAGPTTPASATFVASNSQGDYQLANSGGTAATPLTFQNMTYGSDTQALTISAADASGTNHTVGVQLQANNAWSIDAAINALNSGLQGSGDSTLMGITAVKANVSGTEEVQFVGPANFKVNIGNTTTGTGVQSQGNTLGAFKVGTGGAIDVLTATDAQAAVTAITAAVGILGTAQAAVGKGQNQLNYAVSLAQSQITNFSAAESNIRDANVAQEAANLTKAQVLQQASIAAMAQANSAPQAVLTLLRG